MTTPADDIAALLGEGIALHRAGDLAQAGALYLQVMVKDPGNADAQHLLGVLSCQRGQPAAGLALIRQATKLAPTRLLRAGGRFIFTLEYLAPDDLAGDVKLNAHGRYAHSERHVRDALNSAELSIVSLNREVLRKESGRPVEGLLVCARKL